VERDILTVGVEDAIRKSAECPLCCLIERSENRFLETFYSGWIMNSWLRDKITDSQGFCRYHSHQMLRYAEAHAEKLGLGLVLENLVSDRLQAIEDLRKNTDSLIDVLGRTDLKAILEKKLLGRNPESLRCLAQKITARLGYAGAKCPACLQLLESNASHVETFIQMIAQGEAFKDVMEVQGLVPSSFRGGDRVRLPRTRSTQLCILPQDSPAGPGKFLHLAQV